MNSYHHRLFSIVAIKEDNHYLSRTMLMACLTFTSPTLNSNVVTTFCMDEGCNKLASTKTFIIFGCPVEPCSAQKMAGKGAVQRHNPAIQSTINVSHGN